MLFPRVVVVVSFLVTVLLLVSARPRPGVTRVRHIIHAPIKFRVIHHYRIQKVPIVVKKHVHYLTPQPKPELPLEEGHSNDIQFEHVDEEGGRHRHFHHFYGDEHEEEQQEEEEDDDEDDDVHGHRNPTPFYHGINHDYDESHQQQSQEADYEDYE